MNLNWSDWLDLLDKETRQLFMAAARAQGILADLERGREPTGDAVARGIEAVGLACAAMHRKTITDRTIIIPQEEKAA